MKISFIIITYKRPTDCLEAINSILKESCAFEIIIIDNDPSSNLLGSLPKLSQIQYFKQNSNLGVAGGRNCGIQKAHGEILVFLDDDAIFSSSNICENISEIFERYPDVGCLSFRVENFFTKDVLPKEFPHPDHKLKDQAIYTSYFIGGACAIRKSVFREIGDYLNLVYWGEELELSYRMIKKGIHLFYTPKIRVFHKATPSGRLQSKKLIYYTYRNRYYALAPHLPLQYFFVNITLWSIIWFIQAVKYNAVNQFFKAFSHGMNQTINVFANDRAVLQKNEISYLKKNGGRLWF